jgi:hypothetical protein
MPRGATLPSQFDERRTHTDLDIKLHIAAGGEPEAALLAPLEMVGWWQDAARTEALRRPLLRRCATYLTSAGDSKGSADPVARFHLSMAPGSNG